MPPRAAPSRGRRRAVPLVAALLASGCVIGSNKYQRPRDLDESWLVDGVRVLGIRAEPPEANPGTEVGFEALLVDPAGEVDSIIWLACPPDQANSFGCLIDLDAVDWEEATPEELAELGLIGAEPLFAPTYTPPAELLADADERQRENGLYVTIQTVALPSDLLEDTGGFDYNLVEVSTKLLVVSETEQPNANPLIEGWTVDGHPIPPGAVVEVVAEQGYDLGISVPEASVEEYTWLAADGEVVQATEQLYATWFTTGGHLEEQWTIHPWHEASWIAPSAPTEGTWWAVLRDRRGGMSWMSQDFSVRPAAATGD